VIAEAPLDQPIVSLRFSADGETIVTFQPNTAIRQWRPSNLEMVKSTPVPEGHAWLGSPFAVSPDLKTAVHVDGVNSIVAVNLESGDELWRYNSPAGFAQAMAISPDGKRLETSFGIADGTIQIWNLETGDLSREIVGHQAWVSTLKFWPDGKTLVSASADQTIRIWDMERFEQIRILQGHTLEVWSLDLTSDGSRLVSGSKNGEVLVWDAQREPQRLTAWTVPGRHWNWRFTSGGTAIHAVESDTCRILRYERPTFTHRELLLEIQHENHWHFRYPFYTFSQSGHLFAATALDGVVRVWNLDERKLAHEFAIAARNGRPQPLMFSADETRVWLRHGDADDGENSVLIDWNLKSGKLLQLPKDARQQLRTHLNDGRQFHCLHLKPDNWVFWQGDDSSVFFHDLSTGRTSQPSIATGRLAFLMFATSSPDGELLVLGHDLGVLTVWETDSLREGTAPRLVKTLGGILMSFDSAAFFADGTRLLAGSHAAEAVKIWETQGFNEVLTLEGEGSTFFDIQLSADGSMLGALSGNGKLHLWRAPTWAEIEEREKEDESANIAD
jgi:WD40 repeat protein